DVRIRTCTGLLVDLRRPRYKFRRELWTQVRLASAVFLIDHPEKPNDYLGQSVAGMESALKAYSAIVKSDADARSKPLDDLLKQQTQGKLADAVSASISHCKF